MMHSISPCRIFITAMCAYSFTMHHRTSLIAASNIFPVSAEENIGTRSNIQIKTTEAIAKITRNRERQARVKIEQQLAAVQESQCQDREDFRKLKELMTSQLD
ncbi:hypothetical protein Tco_0462346 [Tanacetum coccineum]